MIAEKRKLFFSFWLYAVASQPHENTLNWFDVSFMQKLASILSAML